jgi:hypothetical protein
MSTTVTMFLNHPFTSRRFSGFIALLLVGCWYISTTIEVPGALLSSTLNTSPKFQERSLESIDICFVSSIFAPTTKTADQPNDFTNAKMENTTTFQFFMYTNLEDLKTPGWTKVIRHFSYRRFITQSRWGKFMAWKDPEMKACQTIFFFDGHFKPAGMSATWSKTFGDLKESIKQSKFGLAQKLHPKGFPPIREFSEILKQRKDIKQNVDASIEWLQAQPDFYDNCTVYDNSFFGKSTTCVLLFIPTLLSIRLPHSVCFVFMQAMILPMYIFKKRQNTFGIITHWRKILGVTSLCGVIRWNISK